jgi:tripartite-type tricarboxylate transporter receptor subunit TctC
MQLTRGSRMTVLAVALALTLVLAACGGGGSGGQQVSASPCDTAPDFPRRPIELIVPWAAGGGTDSVARYIGTALAERLGTQVNVVNRTGGGGVVGHSAIATARPDGTTIGLATVEITMMHWQGLTDLTHEQLTPIAQVNSDAAGVTVATDAPWADVPSLIAAATAQPGGTTASGTGRGGIWDLARAGMLMEAGAPLQELGAGGIHVSTASLVENQTMIHAGRARAIGVMAEERDPKFPDVPTLREQGIDFTMAAWRGIAGPEGLPEDVVAELGCHLDGIVHSPEYAEFMGTAGFGIAWRNPADFGAFMAAQDAEKGEIMRSAGLAG